MGGCLASVGPYRKVYSERREVMAWKKDYETLRFTEAEVGKVFENFVYIDSDKSGSIDIAELLVNCKLDQTPFTMRIFTMFDSDKSGQVDFHECALSLWTFCTLAEEELVMFAYELYDMDGSGSMDRSEVQQILEDVYGKNFHTNPMTKALVTNVKSLPQTVTLEDFTKFCHEHVLLLFPAYEMQTCLIEFFGGKWFWNEIGKRRRHISNGVYMNTKKFMRIYSLGLAEGEGQKQWEFEQERKKALAAGRKKYVINPAASAVVSPELSPTKAKPDHHLIITEKEQSYLLHHSASSPHVSQNEDSRTSTMRRAGSNPKRDSNSPVPRDRRPTDVAGEGAPPAHLKKKPGHHHDKEHKDHHEHHKENPDAFHQKVEMAEGQHGIDIKRTADGSGQTSKASISCSSTSLSESAANSAFSTPHGSIHAKSKSADNGNHHHSAHKKSKGSPGQVMK